MGTFIFFLVIAIIIFIPVYGIHSLRQRHKVRRLQIKTSRPVTGNGEEIEMRTIPTLLAPAAIAVASTATPQVRGGIGESP